MSGNRTIIGDETDDTKKISLDKAINGKTTVPVTIYGPTGQEVNPPSGLITETYNTVTASYNSSNNITQVVYLYNGTVVATLNLTYDGSGNLIGVIKS